MPSSWRVGLPLTHSSSSPLCCPPCVQLPGLHAPGPSAGLQPFRPPTAAQAAEAALAAELPLVAGLGPAAAATQADVDAFLRGLPGAAAPPADFAEFDSIYAAQRPQLPGMPPPGAALPPMAAQGRAAAAPMLQVRLGGGWMAVGALPGVDPRFQVDPPSIAHTTTTAAVTTPCPTGLPGQQQGTGALPSGHGGAPGSSPQSGRPVPRARPLNHHGAPAVCGAGPRVCRCDC